MNTILPAVAVALVGSAHASAIAQTTVDNDGQVTFRALTATPVLGLTPEGLPIVGETIPLGDGGNTSRGTNPTRAFYDTIAFEECSTCTPASRSTPSGFNSQRIADDFSFDSAFTGAMYDGGFVPFRLLGEPGGPAGTNVDLFVSFYESATLNPSFDGGDGFDNDGDGVADAPFDRSTFTGGVILGFGTLPVGTGETTMLAFNAIDGTGIIITLPSTDDDGDGTIDGTFEVSLVSALEDSDGDGVIDTLVPVPGAEFLLSGAIPDYPDACFGAGGRPDLGDSTLGVWAQGEGAIGGLNSWSDGGSSTAFDAVYDPAVDLKVIAPFDQACDDRVHWAVTFLTTATGVSDNRYCADVNGDGTADPGDFTAWTAAYNQGDLRADANQNGSVEPGDFTAWVSAFNLGVFGPQCSP